MVRKYSLFNKSYGKETKYDTLWDLWHGKDHFTTGMTGNDKAEMVMLSGMTFDDPIATTMLDREDLPEDMQQFLQQNPASLIKSRPFDSESKAKEVRYSYHVFVSMGGSGRDFESGISNDLTLNGTVEAETEQRAEDKVIQKEGLHKYGDYDLTLSRLGGEANVSWDVDGSTSQTNADWQFAQLIPIYKGTMKASLKSTEDGSFFFYADFDKSKDAKAWADNLKAMGSLGVKNIKVGESRKRAREDSWDDFKLIGKWGKLSGEQQGELLDVDNVGWRSFSSLDPEEQKQVKSVLGESFAREFKPELQGRKIKILSGDHAGRIAEVTSVGVFDDNVTVNIDGNNYYNIPKGEFEVVGGEVIKPTSTQNAQAWWDQLTIMERQEIGLDIPSQFNATWEELSTREKRAVRVQWDEEKVVEGESYAKEDYIPAPYDKHFEWVASMDQDDYRCKHCGKWMYWDSPQGLNALHTAPEHEIIPIVRDHLATHGITESYAKESDTTKNCPLCGKSVDMGNDDEFFDNGVWKERGTVAMPYKMEDHFETDHTPEDFGLERHTTFDGWTGNMSYSLYKKYFGYESRAKEDVTFGGSYQQNIDDVWADWNSNEKLVDADSDPVGHLTRENWWMYAQARGLTKEQADQKMKEETGESYNNITKILAEESDISHDKCPECNFETSWKEGDLEQEKDAEREMDEHLDKAHKGDSMLDPYANEKTLKDRGLKPSKQIKDQKWLDDHTFQEEGKPSEMSDDEIDEEQARKFYGDEDPDDELDEEEAKRFYDAEEGGKGSGRKPKGMYGGKVTSITDKDGVTSHWEDIRHLNEADDRNWDELTRDAQLEIHPDAEQDKEKYDKRVDDLMDAGYSYDEASIRAESERGV